MKIKAYTNGDDAFVAWKPAGKIQGCRGFALYRRRNGVEEVVSTWVGFEDDEPEPGERRASSSWPIQKYQWTDYMASPGDEVQYRVVPMVGPDKNNLRAAGELASDWTPVLKLDAEAAPGVCVYFNRGIVASQWVSRRLGVSSDSAKAKELGKVISTPGDKFRAYLTGPLGERLFSLLRQAAEENRHVYAVLYELEDRELLDLLLALGERAHVVLANGSVKKKGEDQNKEARVELRGKIELHDRFISPGALGHNKFLVFCDAAGRPESVWTGSTNWTKTGLCTQANNAVFITDRKLAKEYLAQWELLRDAGDMTSPELRDANSRPRTRTLGALKTRLWFTPTAEQVDLEEARKTIVGAKRAILFLMFNPGPKDTLLNAIIKEARTGRNGSRLYIQGAINQDPSTTKNPVELFHRGNSVKADFSVVLPEAIDERLKFWVRELKKLPGTFAMVHSKVVLVDPLSEGAVLITGSHNLGPKASGTNDENMLIIRNAPALTAAYAVNIMSIYNQYRWRFFRLRSKASRSFQGLEDNDTWQEGYLREGSAKLREIDFWVDE